MLRGDRFAMKKKRKRHIVVGAIASAACISLSASACNKPSSSNTTVTAPSSSEVVYNGILSSDVYESKEAAAQYCIEHDYLNENESGSFLFYNKTDDLSDEEINELPISSTEKASLVAAEKGMAHYSRMSSNPTSETSSGKLVPMSLQKTLSGPSKEIYILEFNTDGELISGSAISGHFYKYFIPND
jgi:hypothetical protein